MERLLYELYSGEYDITPTLDKPQSELNQKIIAQLKQVQEQLGLAFVNQLSGLYSDRESLSNFAYYREGFRVGVQLMLEVFTPA